MRSPRVHRGRTLLAAQAAAAPAGGGALAGAGADVQEAEGRDRPLLHAPGAPAPVPGGPGAHRPPRRARRPARSGRSGDTRRVGGPRGGAQGGGGPAPRRRARRGGAPRGRRAPGPRGQGRGPRLCRREALRPRRGRSCVCGAAPGPGCAPRARGHPTGGGGRGAVSPGPELPRGHPGLPGALRGHRGAAGALRHGALWPAARVARRARAHAVCRRPRPPRPRGGGESLRALLLLRALLCDLLQVLGAGRRPRHAPLPGGPGPLRQLCPERTHHGSGV
mmetsp:Transcript_7931/g.26901  ORF Transcript_7931/g.26901 Transcript_7931/m.26901 type:complete len:278 (-) Transcript_7931:1229-2062(-)